MLTTKKYLFKSTNSHAVQTNYDKMCACECFLYMLPLLLQESPKLVYNAQNFNREKFVPFVELMNNTIIKQILTETFEKKIIF